MYYNQQSSNLFLAWYDFEPVCQHKYMIYMIFMYGKGLLYARQAVELHKNILNQMNKINRK